MRNKFLSRKDRSITFVGALLLWLAANHVVAADLHVVLRNATRNQAATVELVKLLELGEKMRSLGEAKWVNGKKIFSGVEANRRYLVLVQFQGVQYFHILEKKDIATVNGVIPEARVDLFEHRKGQGKVQFFLDHLIFRKDGTALSVQATYKVKNMTKDPGPVVVSIPGGYVIPAPKTEDQDISISSSYGQIPEHMDVRRLSDGGFSVRNPLKPGETQVVVEYKWASMETQLQWPFFIENSSLFYVPKNMKLTFSDGKYFIPEKSADFPDLGYYRIRSLPAGMKIQITFSGGSEKVLDNQKKNDDSGKVIALNPVDAIWVALFAFLIGTAMVARLWILMRRLEE